ncbi:MAG: O-antigen ligase family protein [bacterium]|nr:O-antigen ligase family protein [bacterium]
MNERSLKIELHDLISENSKITYFTSLHLIICILTGLIFGLSLALGKPLIAFAALIGLLAISLVLKQPELGILFIVLIDASIIFEEAIPVIPLGIGSFHGTDIILFGMLFLIPINLAINPSFKIVKTPMNLAVIVFYLAVLLSAMNGLFFTKVHYKIIMRLMRIFSYYLMFFVITHFINTKQKITFIIKGLFMISVIVTLAMMLQAVLGSNVQIMPGRIETARTFETEYEATRILPPGQTLIQVMLITAFCLSITLDKNFFKSKYFYLIFIIGIANLLTFNRSTWVTQIMSIGLFTLLIPEQYKKKVIAWAVITLMIAGLFMAVIIPAGGQPAKTIIAVSDRFTSLFTGEKIQESATLKWRRLENYAAIKKIKKDWFLGIGLGNAFTWKKKAVSYMHNFYLWIILNMGIVGFIAFAWYYLLFLFRGFKYWKKIKDDYLRAVYISFTLSGLGLIPGAMVNPQFREWYSIIIITIMVGINESILYYNSNKEYNKNNG